MNDVTNPVVSRGLPETSRRNRRLPSWLKRRLGRGNCYTAVSSCLSSNHLRTVCVEARCPNRAECFSSGTAAFLIMGNACTRHCAFCAIGHGAPAPLDDGEPARIAAAAERLRLRHIVITSVTRDDLPDGGACHFAECVEQCRSRVPGASIEILIPDFRGKSNALDIVLASRPHVLNHNLETVPRLYPKIRPKADYHHSLGVLSATRSRGISAKSGIMVGLGETDEEIIAVLKDLFGTGCNSVTLGQYLQPSRDQAVPERYVEPVRFAFFEKTARDLGFLAVMSGPFVRSSYHSLEAFKQASGG